MERWIWLNYGRFRKRLRHLFRYNSGAILKESPKRPPHIELSLKQSFIQSRLQHLSRQTIMSESRMVSKGPEG